MITPSLKATAIARIKCSEPLEEIARELDIPLAVVKELYNGLDNNDLIRLEANVFALGKLTNGDIIPPSDKNEQMLKMKIEEVAIDIVDEVGLCVTTADPIRAKTLQLCADTVSKLYTTLISKLPAGEGGVSPNGKTIEAFKSIMKD